jgi:opacity protein-like surface antigen
MTIYLKQFWSFSFMKRFLTGLLLSLASFANPLSADFYCDATQNCCDDSFDYQFYVKAGSGISFSQDARVVALPPTWDPAIQGYNAKMGNRPIFDLGLGCSFMKLANLEVSGSFRPGFKYRKFQTPSEIVDPISYTREFDLDLTTALVSITLTGQTIPYLNWNLGCGTLYPIIGAGVGSSRITIYNFRTTGLPPSESSAPFNSFSAENQYCVRDNFTYTATAGLEYSSERWALGTGYRWFDAGRFKGPRFKRVATGAAIDIAGDEWKIQFKAHEWYIEFKIFI